MQPELLAPIVNPDSAEYWAGARDGKLLIRKCRSCSAVHFMPRHLCPTCWSDQLDWVEACGRGTVHSFTILRRPSEACFSGRVPLVVALIDLEEGPRMVTNIVGDDALQVDIDDPVTVCFEDRPGGSRVPQFRRAAGAGR